MCPLTTSIHYIILEVYDIVHFMSVEMTVFVNCEKFFVSINLSGNAQKCGLLAKPVLENCRRSVIFQNNVFSSLIRRTLEIRSMFHFIEWRIEVHAYISYITYNVYRELERVVPGLVSN